MRPALNDEGKYVCLTDGTALPATPEETVRQEFIAILMNEYGYPANRIRREVPIYRLMGLWWGGEGVSYF